MKRIIPALAVVFFAASMFADTVVVFNEIMYHPATNEPSMEWVELHNQHAVDVDLSGWSLDGGIHFTFAATTIIRGNGYLVIASSPTALMAASGLTDVLGPFTGRLSNGGDKLQIKNNSGRVMDEISYGVDGDWPVAPDGSGVSLSKMDRDASSGAAANWTTSDRMGGTPGTENFAIPGVFNPPAGLVSYWAFNEASGPALDKVGVNHGTLGSGTTRSPGAVVGGALSFNGTTNAFVNFGPGAANSFAVSNGVTVETVLLPGWNGTGSSVIFKKALRTPGAYQATVLANNPLAYWRLNDATTTITDATANAHNGTATAGVLLNEPSLIPTDPANHALRTIGGDRVVIPGFEKIGAAGYTVEFWVKVHQLPTTCCQNLVGDGDTDNDFFLMNYILGPDQGVVGAIRPHYSFGNSPVSMDSPTALQVGNVYHIVTTWDTSVSVNNAVIYINGVPDRVGTITRNVPALGTTGDNSVYIGHDQRAAGDGSYTYDEVALYNRPLTGSDVAAHYAAGTATNFAVDAGNAIQLAFQNDGNNAQANPPVAAGQVLSFGLTVGGVYSELDMPLDGQAGRPTLADLKNGQPHHLAATYDSSSGLKAIYIDGVMRFSVTLSGLMSANNAANAILGNSEVNGTAPFTGTLDEGAYWRRGLLASEVAAHASAIQAGRDYFTPGVSAVIASIGFNEVSSGTNAQFSLELVNYGTNTTPLEGFVIVRDGTNNNEYVFPVGISLTSHALLAVTDTTLGFHPEPGDKLYLLPADRSRVLDSVVVKARDRARSPDATGPWLFPTQLTPGASNSFTFHNEIVINEIMYNHALVGGVSNFTGQPSYESWLELFNRSPNTIDLTGWELDGGISYQFGAGQTMAPGTYLIVAKDSNSLAAVYPGINIVGNFDKSLSHSSDSIVLKDPSGNPANQVRYFGAGHWPEYPDGGGSSLELRDPNADNSKAEAWAASIESGKSSWNNYSYKMTAQNIVGPAQWNDFILGLLSNGECLIDDISVIESPTTSPVEFVTNGNFESGITGWRAIGTQTRSRVELDPDNAANHVLHIISSGPQEHMHNHIETTIAGGRAVANGREYQISFRAKWIAGNNLLNTRLYFDRVARTTVLPMPSLNGTPGAQNSRFEPNIGPTFSQFQHRPIIPQAGQVVTVSVIPQDANGVGSCQVWFSANGGAWTIASMTASNGLYSGNIPGLGAGTTVQFFVRATDALGAISTYPAGGSNSAALYTVNDGQANLPLAHNVRVILSPANTALLHAFTNVMSNDTLPCTVIYDEKRAYYDMGVRLKGSERGRYSDTRVSFHLEFQPDDLFRGVHPVMLIDRSGAGDSAANKQQEILVRHILLHAGDVPGPQPDLCRIIAPLSAHTGPGILSPRHEDEFVSTAYDHGADGTLYELELIYYPTTADAGGYKNPQPDNVTGVDISDLGNDKEPYRYDFIIKNHRDGDDYSPFIRLGKTFSLPTGPVLESQAAQVMDVNEWLRAFAIVTLCGIGDTYTFGNNHNLLMYLRPSDQKMLAFPWDMDFSFNRGTGDALVGDQNLSKIINLPSNLRCFYAHIVDIINTTYNSSYITYWANHYTTFCPGQSFAGVPAYVQARANSALTTINAAGGNSPFAVNGPSVLSTSNNLLVVSGTAPVQVKTIQINGIAYPVTWSSVSGWTIRVPLPAATNTLVFSTYDLHGNLLPAFGTTLFVTYTGALVDPKDALVINEIMYKSAVSNAAYVEIFNNSATSSFDLSNWKLKGVDYTFPPGTIITNRQFLVIAKDSGSFAATYGAAIPVLGQFDGNLDPDGEKLALVKPGVGANPDQEIDAIRYESGEPWPAAANGGGSALQLIDASQDDSRVSNWSDGSGWRFFSFTSLPGAITSSTQTFTITLDAAGDFYIDELSLVFGPVAGNGQNLFQNGGFESGLLSPWAAIGNHAGSALSSAVKYSGNNALRIVGTGPGSVPNNEVAQTVTNIIAGNSYTLSFWYLPSTNVSGFNFRLTSTFRTQTSISLAPSPASPGGPNLIARAVEPYPLLWINEIEPNNVTGILDNNSEHDPWIELYNSGPGAITLDGYALANSYASLDQWPFPVGSVVNPGEYKVIFTDGQPGQTLGNELHTSFRLDPTNGSIVLSKLGRILDYINYTNMDANFSYGSYLDGQVVDRQRFFYVTPGLPNNPSPVPVVINEWLASNTNNIIDPVTGKHEDWVELYNFGAIAIDLSGFFLTDNLNQKKEWAFPVGTVISPGGFLLIWADNEATNSTPGDLHAHFQLSKNGEEIGLSTPDGLTVDTVKFGGQFNDVSQGRYTDGNFGGVLYFMNTPTPNAANIVPANLSTPVLPLISNRNVDEGSSLSITNLATDADIPPQTLTYTLGAGAPSGAVLNPNTGVFTWTPTEVQGGAVYPVTIQVSDNGVPVKFASRAFNITVNKVNSPPTLLPLLTRTVAENTTLSFAISASDSDLPQQTVSYSLDPGFPAGASVDASTGAFSWTPNEAQGPTTNSIVVRVTDNGVPSASATQTLTVVVTEVNTAPVLVNPGVFTIDEGKLFNTTMVATDSDLPTNKLTFGTLAPFVSGITINGSSGLLAWTPSETQGGASYLVTVRVFDNGTPSLSATQSFTINVSKTNNLPVMNNLNNTTRTINELTSITLTNKATDNDIPTNILTYEIVSAPTNAVVNPTNGIFTWTPSEEQGPSSNLILVRAYDNGTPSLSATQRFTINVNEVNLAPVLSSIPNQTVSAGVLLRFTNVVNDPDLPAQAMTFTLGPGAPAGASVDSGSGIFSWTPTSGQAPTTNSLSMRVADNGTPSLSATQTFTVFVVTAVQITAIHQVSSSQVSITWSTEIGKTYQAEFRDDLDPATIWQPVPGSQVTADSTSQSMTINPGIPAHRFYRIARLN